MVSPAVRIPPTTTTATSAGFIQQPGGSPSPSTSTSKPTTSPPEPVMPSLPELSTISPTTDYMGEFSQFDQTFGSYESNKSNGENSKENECDSMNENSGSSMWDVMLSLYLPVLLLWLRRSMFGTANLVRSLVLGHCLRLLFGNVSGWMSEKMTPSWLATLTIHSSSSSNGKGVDSWPPPALVALALLTIFTLVVHPDGLTWIMLGKLRDTMMSFFQYSTECWNLVVQDYGVIPTFAAAATFAVLLFLFFCMGRTLRRTRSPSKSTTPHHPPERKKKKRKGHARHRGGGGGPNHNSNSGTRIKSSSRERQKPSSEQLLARSSDNLPDLTPVSTASTRTTIDPTFDSCPPPEMEPPESGALATDPSSSSNIASTSVPFTPSPPRARLLQQNEKEKQQQQQQQRSRMTSVSTADTTPLSDDQSCESSSVRSIPSVSVGSTRSHDLEKQQHPSKQQSQHSGSKQAKSNTPSNRRNKKKGKHHPKHNAPLSSENPPLVASSRWDALKPSQPSHGPYNSNSHGNNNTNHNHQYQHHPKHHHGRGGGGRNNRKAGVGGGGGRHQQNNHQHHQHHAANANSFFSSKNTNAVGVARPAPNSPVTSTLPNDQLRASGSPPNLTKPMMTLPPPPPGLGPLPSSAVVPALGGGSGSYSGSNNSMMTTLSTMSSKSGVRNCGSAPTPSFFDNHHHLAVNRAAAAISVASSSSGGNSLKYVSDSFLNGGGGGGFLGDTSRANNQHHQQLKLKENPFAPEDNNDDSQIEADLQKLGGQMAGSILDF